MPLVEPAPDLGTDSQEGRGVGGTFAAETDVADEDIAGDVHCEDVLGREEVEEVRVFRLLIHPQDPAIRVTEDAANMFRTLHFVRAI